MRATFASFYAVVDGKGIAATVTDDGIVRTRATMTPLECDPATLTVVTRGSVQSAALKIGYNRIDHVSMARVQSAGVWRTREMSLETFVTAGPTTPDATKGKALWDTIVAAYSMVETQ